MNYRRVDNPGNHGFQPNSLTHRHAEMLGMQGFLADGAELHTASLNQKPKPTAIYRLCVSALFPSFPVCPGLGVRLAAMGCFGLVSAMSRAVTGSMGRCCVYV